MHRNGPNGISFASKKDAKLCLANSRGILQHGIGTPAVARRASELEMILSTSAVAVCCSSDCAQLVEQPVFSMAMTAWAAKFLTSSICLSVNGRTSWRLRVITPISSSSLSIGTPSTVRNLPSSAETTVDE